MANLAPAQRKALEAKALKQGKEGNKSAGMRDLLEAGYDVKEVAAVFDAPYGFVYGVAVRGGFVTPEPRAEKAAAPKAATKPAAKAAAKPAAKAAAKPAPRAVKPAAKPASKAKAKA